MRLCIFDLDHTLVASSLDLAAMAVDMRTLIERELGPLPERPERYRVGERVFVFLYPRSKLGLTLSKAETDALSQFMAQFVVQSLAQSAPP